MKCLGIICDRNYIKYFSDINNWIIEEVLAVSVAKRMEFDKRVEYFFHKSPKEIKSYIDDFL